jgi:RimJ/RimL family protein N-acetyltransferase
MHAPVPFQPIRTPRLIVRHFRAADIPTLLAYRNDPEVARYQSWTSMSESMARLFVAEMAQTHPGVAGTWFQFAVEECASGAHIGDCALHTLADDARLGEIGYTFARAAQGKGYAREAVQAVLDYAFGALAMHRIAATVDTENAPSIRLLERLGFRREATFLQCAWFKGAWCNEHVYAMLQDEWQAQGERT